jgi:anti-anti-sigma regulatory factor
MAHVGSCFLTVPPVPPPGSEPEPIVVWLAGEHDISTVGALWLTLARAIAREPAALDVDLSGVELMSAPTLKTIARAREVVRLRSRSLPVRSPSAFVRRIIDACDSTGLLDPQAGNLRGEGLGSAGDPALR